MLLLIASSSACADRDPEVPGWPHAGAQLAFLLSLRDGQVRQIHGPFQAAELEAGPIRVETDPDAEVFALVIEHQALLALDPRIDLGRLGVARLETQAPECPEGTLEDEVSLWAALTHIDHQLFVLEPRVGWRAAPTVEPIEASSLVLPFDGELPCRPRRVRFEPFMRDDRVLPEGTVVDGAPRSLAVMNEDWRYFGLASLAWLEPARAVFASSVRLYLVDEGGVFVDEPGVHIPTALFSGSLPGVGWTVNRVRNDPTYQEANRHRLFVVLQIARRTATSTHHGALVELIVSDQGLESTRTATVGRALFSSLEISSSGQFVMGGRYHDGGPAFLMFGSVSGGIEQTIERSGFDGAFERIVETGDPDLPYVVSVDAHLYGVRRAQSGVFELEHWSAGRVMSLIRSIAVRRVEGGIETWIGSYSSGLFRRDPDGVWTQIFASLPESAATCAGTNIRCGRRTMENVVMSMGQLGDGRIGMGIESCDALIVLDPETNCLEAVSVDGRAIGRDRYNRLSHHAESAWGTLFGGSDSSLRVATLEPP